MRSKIIVVAIDIGKTWSTCAYSFCHSPTDIFCDKFIFQKVQTVLLFDEMCEFHSIGNEAEDHFKQLKDEEKKDWYYFKDFHHILNQQKPTEFETTECNGKRLETYKVYGSVIKFFKDGMCTLSRKTDSGISEDDMHFVLTVPPIFSRSLNSMLREAFSFAGINDNYSYVNESEAILYYLKHMLDHKQELPNNVDLETGDGFLLVNLKGTTAMTTATSVTKGIPHRLAFISGGGWGGQAAYEEFKQFLVKVTGAPTFLKYIEAHFNYQKLQSYFELKSKNFHGDNKIIFNFPELFIYYEEEYNEDIDNVVVQDPSFSKSVSIISPGKVLIKPSSFKGFFRNTLETIISNITNILLKRDVKEITVIVMVGYFSELKLVQDAVKSAFPDYCILFPIDPEFTILKGAVLKGHYKNNILSEYTFCAHVLHINNEREFPKVLEERTEILIKKGERVQGGKRNWILEVNTFDMEYVEIQLFASQNLETYAPVSINSEDVVIFNKKIINCNGAHRIKIEVTIRLEINEFSGEISHTHCSLFN